MKTVMTHSPDRSDLSSESSMDTELDLLYHVLDSRSNYPWNPQDPESDRLLAETDMSWNEAETADAIALGWQRLSSQLDSIWASQASSAVDNLVSVLSQRFANRMPTNLLRQIAQQAMAMADVQRPMMEQLVQCTRNLLAEWETEDIEVLARPLAYSLRDGQGEILDLHLRSIRQAEWSSLSEIERARLSLAIASFAIQQAQASEE